MKKSKPKPKPKPREYTTEEVKQHFLKKVWSLINYWDNQDDTPRTRIEGVVFSLLAEIDGSGIELPGFKLIPNPHPSDKAYCKKKGKNWYPNKGDIAGLRRGLHDDFYAAQPDNPCPACGAELKTVMVDDQVGIGQHEETICPGCAKHGDIFAGMGAK